MRSVQHLKRATAKEKGKGKEDVSCFMIYYTNVFLCIQFAIVIVRVLCMHYHSMPFTQINAVWSYLRKRTFHSKYSNGGRQG